MQLDTLQNKKYFIHIIYAASFLIAVFSVIGYLVWSKHNAALHEQVKKAKTLTCLTGAQQDYLDNWAASCTQHAKLAQSALNNCINISEKTANYIGSADSFINRKRLYQTYAAQCKSTYGKPNFEPNCSLPASIAKNINDCFQKEAKLCEVIS